MRKKYADTQLIITIIITTYKSAIKSNN